jgi:hypothetical protein
MQRFIPIILRRKFNAVGDPIPKEMSVRPQWDNTARIVHTLNAITYRLSKCLTNCWDVISPTVSLSGTGGGSIASGGLLTASFASNPCLQPRVLTNSIDKLSKDGIMQRFIPIILRRKFNAVGDPIPKEMSVKPQWDNTARIVHTLNAITYRPGLGRPQR